MSPSHAHHQHHNHAHANAHGIGAAEAPHGKWLLIVDDSDAERQLMAHTLGSAFPGAEIRHTGAPEQVTRMCEENAYDCVLLDYNMPEMDGLTLARELRAANPYLPLVLFTSVGDEMLVAEALRSGISDYIPKSRVTADSILRLVGRSIHVCAQARLIEEQRGELENFSYALAHDFKQPIRQITTFSQMVSESIRNGETEGVDKQLTFMSDAAIRLGKLVDVMLQYTLLNQPHELSEVDLNVVTASVRAALAGYLAEREGEFVTPSYLPTIRGNETLMIQVLQNLVVNGLKYNRSPAPRVELSARRRAEHWYIEVRDNGLGIDEEYLTDIFKPLIRLHTASEFPGSGLGLTLARKAVIAQKGSIWCESTPGEGSVFHIRVPAARPDRRGVRRSSAVPRGMVRGEAEVERRMGAP